MSSSSVQDRQVAETVAQQVKPGDIIFVTTPGQFYAFWRNITNNMHDHAVRCMSLCCNEAQLRSQVVVLDAETVLHIGPPRARKLPLQRLLLPKRQPAILRPKLSPSERDHFVGAMKSLEHCTYDLGRAYRVILRLALDHMVRCEFYCNYSL